MVRQERKCILKIQNTKEVMKKQVVIIKKRLEEEQQRREIWMKDRLRGLLVAMENIDKIYPFEEKYDGCIKFLRNLNEKDKGWI